MGTSLQSLLSLQQNKAVLPTPSPFLKDTLVLMGTPRRGSPEAGQATWSWCLSPTLVAGETIEWGHEEGICLPGKREQPEASPEGRLKTGMLGWVVMAMGMDSGPFLSLIGPLCPRCG